MYTLHSTIINMLDILRESHMELTEEQINVEINHIIELVELDRFRLDQDEEDDE